MNPAGSRTHSHIQRHTPSGFCIYTVCSDGTSSPPVVYRGEDCVDRFFDALNAEERKINDVLRHPTPMIFTADNERDFESATNCHICDHPLDQNRVRDHDHLTGSYRGAAHSKCNLDYRFRRGKGFFIPVVFHNLRGYDSHFLYEQWVNKEDRSIALRKTCNNLFHFRLDSFGLLTVFSLCPHRLTDSCQM